MISFETFIGLAAIVNIWSAGYVYARREDTAVNLKENMLSIFWSVTFMLFGSVIITCILIAIICVALAGWLNRTLLISYMFNFIVLDKVPPVGYIKAIGILRRQRAKMVFKWWNLKLYLHYHVSNYLINKFERKLDDPKTTEAQKDGLS